MSQVQYQWCTWNDEFRQTDATTADVRVVVLYVAAVPVVLFVVTKLALGL